MDTIYKSDTKRVFLTFDDGPSPVTSKILDILKQENVKATFFILGSNVDSRKDVVKRMYEEGHYLANHGYSHTYSKIYSSPQSVLDEYNECNDKVKNAIEVPDYNSHLFRFPGGLAGGKYAEIKKEAKEILLQNNIVNVDWNALTGDAETNNLSVEFEMTRLTETMESKNSLVILMHDAAAKSVTADALPQIIAKLKEEGYVREILSKVQNMRKDKGFEVLDKINLYVSENEMLEELVKKFESEIKKETLTENIVFNTQRNTYTEVSINGEKLMLDVEVVK